jgi:magnesium transporter
MATMTPEPTKETCGHTAELERFIGLRDWESVLKKLHDIRTAEEAGLFCLLDRERTLELLAQLSASDLAEMMETLPDTDVCRFCDAVDADTMADVLDQTAPERAAHVLRELPEARANEVMAYMKESETIIPLLSYERGTAGYHMSPRFVALAPEMTVDEAIAALRAERPHRDSVDTLYVIDKRGKLRGVMTLRQLVLARSSARLRNLMEKKVLTARADMDERECVRLMEDNNISSLPVVDKNGHMLGIITPGQLLHVTQEQATADMYHMVGVDESERLFSPLPASLGKRLPWLLVSLGFAFLSGLVVNAFNHTIAVYVALAAYLPLISAVGTNTAVQTATVVVRSLATGELRQPLIRRAVARETALGTLNGGVIACASGLIAYVWMQDLWLAQVFAAAMFITVGLGGVQGVTLPLILRRFRADPALGSSVLLATLTDITGFVFFLGIATVLLRTFPGA